MIEAFVIDPSAPVWSECERLTRWAKTIGVNVTIDYDDLTTESSAGSLHIPDIGRDRSNPNTRGHGRLVINAILDLADAHQLVVEIEHMTDETTLGAYYRSFGFKPYGEQGAITNLRRLAHLYAAENPSA